MQDSKLIKILRTLSKEEFKYLGWFVRSNFFNTDKNLVKFYDFLKKHHPDFVSARLEKRTAFQVLFPSTQYSDGKMRNLISKMTNLSNEYLISLELKNNGEKKQQMLVDVYASRNVDYNEYKKKSHELIGLLEKRLSQHPEDTWQLFRLHNNFYFYSKTPKSVDTVNYLLKAKKNIELTYVIFLLKILCELKARELIFHENHEAKTIDPYLLQKITSIAASPLAQVYSKIYEMQHSGTIESYQAAKESFNFHLKAIDNREVKPIFQLLLNFAIFNHNKGEPHYSEEVFHLYKIGIDTRIWFEDGIISDTAFFSIASQGASTGEFEWTELFIKKYKKHLRSELKDQTISISWGYWYFFRADHSKSLDVLQGVAFSNTTYKIASRLLLVRSYFELYLKDDSYYDLTNYSIESFEKFLKRSKNISKSRSEIIQNFLRELKKLVKFYAAKEIH